MSDSIPGKFARSWAIFTNTLQLIRQQKKLLLFPLVTLVCSVVMMLFFFAPALLYPSGHPIGEAAHWQSLGAQFGLDLDGPDRVFHPNALFYGYTAAIYLVSMFLATFVNVAFYQEIMKAFAGEPVSIAAGLKFASTRLRAILMWSLFAGLIGLAIKLLEQRFGWIGRLVMKFVGVVWSVASVFAIPVIIREDNANPIDLLRNSASTLRKTWGEMLIGYIGLSAGTWIVVITSLVLFGGAFALGAALDFEALILFAIIGWLLAVVVYGYVAGVAGHIYRCALYVYASEGVVPAPYNAGMMDAAWKVKKS